TGRPDVPGPRRGNEGERGRPLHGRGLPPAGDRAADARRAGGTGEGEWAAQLEGCRFLADEEASLPGEPAVRVVAVGSRRRREAVLMVHGNVGCRVTCEAPERTFERVRGSFDDLLARFRLVPSFR